MGAPTKAGDLSALDFTARAHLADRMRWRDEFWVRGEQKIHVPVNADTGTVEITTEALAQILRDAGWMPGDA